MPDHDMAVPRFVQPTRDDMRRAAEIVDSPAAIGAYAAVEWDCWNEDGQTQLAAIVREAQSRVRVTADTIVHANAFLAHMAERFRERTSRRFLGLRFNWMQPMEAMSCALATFDAWLDMEEIAFGNPQYGWDRDHAHDLVDEELQHWES